MSALKALLATPFAPQRLALAALSLIVPIQPLLQDLPIIGSLKTYRLVEVALLLMALTAVTTRRMRAPRVVEVAFWLGIAGWILATIWSAYPLQSLDTGTLEFLVPFCVFYIFLAYGDDRQFLLTCAALFVSGVLAVSALQAWNIISALQIYSHFYSIEPEYRFFPSAENFQFYKASVPTILRKGVPASYGNVDNYASLWVFLIPLIGGSAILPTRRWLVGVLFLALLYFGLFVYSRGALIIVAISLVALLIYQATTARTMNSVIVAGLAIITLIHVSPSSLSYFSAGMTSFKSEMRAPAPSNGNHQIAVAQAGDDIELSPDTVARPEFRSPDEVKRPRFQPQLSVPEIPMDEETSGVDNSGSNRADALLAGWRIGVRNLMTGIGYGVYPIVEPSFTSPHNQALLRLCESGILGLLSFLILALYAPARIVLMIARRRHDTFAAICLVAVGAFMLKAIVFGASFAISSNIVWGFAVMATLAASLSKETSDRSAH